jgi:hypothetical protein
MIKDFNTLKNDVFVQFSLSEKAALICSIDSYEEAEGRSEKLSKVAALELRKVLCFFNTF